MAAAVSRTSVFRGSIRDTRRSARRGAVESPVVSFGFMRRRVIRPRRIIRSSSTCQRAVVAFLIFNSARPRRAISLDGIAAIPGEPFKPTHNRVSEVRVKSIQLLLASPPLFQLASTLFFPGQEEGARRIPGWNQVVGDEHFRRSSDAFPSTSIIPIIRSLVMLVGINRRDTAGIRRSHRRDLAFASLVRVASQLISSSRRPRSVSTHLAFVSSRALER